MVSEEQLKHADRIRRKLATPSSLLNVLKEIGNVSDDGAEGIDGRQFK
jgi:hypothetical protein